MNIAVSNTVPGTPLAEPSVSSDKGRGLGFSALLDAVKSTSNAPTSDIDEIGPSSDRRDAREPLEDRDSETRSNDRDDPSRQEAERKSEPPGSDRRDAPAPLRENETSTKDDRPARGSNDDQPPGAMAKDDANKIPNDPVADADAPNVTGPVASEIPTAPTPTPTVQANDLVGIAQNAGAPKASLPGGPTDLQPIATSTGTALPTDTPILKKSNAPVSSPGADAKTASLPLAPSASSNDGAPSASPAPTAPQGGQTPVLEDPNLVAAGQRLGTPHSTQLPSTVAPAQTALDTALQAKGLTPEQVPAVKVTVEAPTAAPKSLVSVATPGAAILAENSYGGNSGTGSGTGNPSSGGTTTAADVLLGAQAAAQGEFSATAAALSPQLAARAPASVTATTEALPAVGTAGLAGGTLPSLSQAVAASTRPVATPPAVSDQIGMQIARAAQSGTTRFNIQLQPAELGRVDVRMEVGHDGKITAMVTADRQDTLDLLQRDARGLERSLQNAGLKADANSLSFSLRNQGDGDGTLGREYASQTPGTPGNEDTETASADASELAALMAATGTENGGTGRLNILV